VSVAVVHDSTPGFERDLAVRGITFWTNEIAILRDEQWVPIAKQDDANATSGASGCSSSCAAIGR
jgi:hypothetical protein